MNNNGSEWFVSIVNNHNPKTKKEKDADRILSTWDNMVIGGELNPKALFSNVCSIVKSINDQHKQGNPINADFWEMPLEPDSWHIAVRSFDTFLSIILHKVTNRAMSFRELSDVECGQFIQRREHNDDVAMGPLVEGGANAE